MESRIDALERQLAAQERKASRGLAGLEQQIAEVRDAVNEIDADEGWLRARLDDFASQIRAARQQPAASGGEDLVERVGLVEDLAVKNAREIRGQGSRIDSLDESVVALDALISLARRGY